MVYESLRLPIPGEGEAVLSTPDATGMQQQPMQDPFAFLKKNSESVAAANAEDEEEPEEDRPKKRRSLLNREALASTLSELFSESLLARKGANVEAKSAKRPAPPPETPPEECESKDKPHCPYHGFPKDWKPLPDIPRTSITDALKQLKAGITAQDPLGNKITLDRSILRHWVKEKKSKKDIKRRLAHLQVVVQCVKTPAEIWEQEDGTRIYMAAFHSRYEREYEKEVRVYPMAFTVDNDSLKIQTYYLNIGGINRKRKGKCLYSEAKVTPDA